MYKTHIKYLNLFTHNPVRNKIDGMLDSHTKSTPIAAQCLNYPESSTKPHKYTEIFTVWLRELLQIRSSDNERNNSGSVNIWRTGKPNFWLDYSFWYVSNEMRLYTIHLFLENCSTCFGQHLHPSSGAHTTVFICFASVVDLRQQPHQNRSMQFPHHTQTSSN